MVVVSPHLDDAVLSLGAAIARAARSGICVEVLTVFACDPDSTAVTKGWDARSGFRTEGEAARARREEDSLACAVLGARPVWLSFGSVDYERHGGESDVRDAVLSAFAGADTVLLPGSPLTHPDHVWLVRVLAPPGLPCRRLGLYAEQPYTLRTSGRRTPEVPEWLERGLGRSISFQRVPAGGRERLAKWRAIRRYRSQLPLLGLSRRAGSPLHRLLWSEARAGGEAVAWMPESASPAPA